LNQAERNVAIAENGFLGLSQTAAKISRPAKVVGGRPSYTAAARAALSAKLAETHHQHIFAELLRQLFGGMYF
jgi:hypothetical protein